MSAYLSLRPFSAAVFARLDVAALKTTLGVTGIYDDAPQGTALPYVEFDVREERQLGGLGTYPGNGQMPLVQLRVSVFSGQTGRAQLRNIMAKVIELLTVTPLTVVGYTVQNSGKPEVRETVPLFDEPSGGINVKEEATLFEYWLEEAA